MAQTCLYLNYPDILAYSPLFLRYTYVEESERVLHLPATRFGCVQVRSQTLKLIKLFNRLSLCDVFRAYSSTFGENNMSVIMSDNMKVSIFQMPLRSGLLAACQCDSLTRRLSTV